MAKTFVDDHGIPEPSGVAAYEPEIFGETAYELRQNRIEALRCASRIVAGELSCGSDHRDDTVSIEDFTIMIAEQFAKWLESGE